MKEAAKQPKKAKLALSGQNQWREEAKGSTYLRNLFVEGEMEKERRFLKFEERLNSFGVRGEVKGENPKGKVVVDLSAGRGGGGGGGGVWGEGTRPFTPHMYIVHKAASTPHRFFYFLFFIFFKVSVEASASTPERE